MPSRKQKMLYRGWSEKFHKYIYGGIACDSSGNYYVVPRTLIPILVLRTSVGQSTGMHDKHNELIFEGDIVKCLNGELAVVKMGMYRDAEKAQWLYGYLENLHGRNEYGWYLQNIKCPSHCTQLISKTWDYCEIIKDSKSEGGNYENQI